MLYNWTAVAGTPWSERRPGGIPRGRPSVRPHLTGIKTSRPVKRPLRTGLLISLE